MDLYLVRAKKHQHSSIKCSLGDHFVFHTPVSVVFFYRKSIPAELFIHALEHVLNDFPVFAGILFYQQEHLNIDCNNQGVQLRIVHSQDSLFDSLDEIQKLKTRSFIDAIHPKKFLRQRKPVLTIKLSYYEDGLAIGYCWHHSVGDMATFMQFLTALSAFAKGESYSLPIIAADRDEYLSQWTQNRSVTNLMSGRLSILGFFDILRFVTQIYLPKKNLYLYFSASEMSNLKNSLSIQAGKDLTRNDALCAHLLNLVSQCRKDKVSSYNMSVVLNFRERIGIPGNALGNFVDALAFKHTQPWKTELVASSIHAAVQGYKSFNSTAIKEFLQNNGGIKNIARIIPQDFLPQHKNLIITNWSNFEVYSIDFGVIKPSLFLPVGQALLPWVSCIVEGFENKGLLTNLALPRKVADRLSHPAMQAQIHKYASL